MAATVEGVFRILDRASPALDKIHAKATRLDEKLNATGRTMDKFAGEGSADLKTLDTGFQKMGTQAQKDTSKVSAGMDAMQRKIGSSTSAAQRDIQQLNANLGLLDAQRADPNVDLAGFDETLAKIKLLRAEMAKLSAESAQMQVGINVTEMGGGGGGSPGRRSGPSFGQTMARSFFDELGLPSWMRGGGGVKGMAGRGAMAGAGAGARWGARKAKSGASRLKQIITNPSLPGADEVDDVGDASARAAGKMSLFSRVAKTMAYRVATIGAAIVALGPILEAFIGALGALVGTSGGAIAAAGAGGTGLIGAAIVGFGGMYAASRPLFTQMGLLNKSFQAYSTTVRQFGANSQEARDAQKELNAVMKANGAMGGVSPERQLDLLQKRQRMGEEWRKRTVAGQRSTMGLMENGLDTADRNLPFLAGISNQGAAGVEAMGGSFLDKLDSPMFRESVGSLADLFEKMSPQVGSVLGNTARTFANIANAASPLVIDFIKYLDDWMGGNAQSTSRTSHWSKVFKDWERDLRQVSHFLKEIGKWLLTFFDAGRGPGRGLLKDMTVDIRQSRKGMEEDGGAGVKQWFQEMVDRTKDVWQELQDITKQLGKLVHMVGNLIGPYADMSQKTQSFVRQIPVVGPAVAPFAGPAAAAAGFFGTRAAFRGGLKRLPGAAGRWAQGKYGPVGMSTRAYKAAGMADDAARVAGGARGASTLGRVGGFAARGLAKLALPLTAVLGIKEALGSNPSEVTPGGVLQDSFSAIDPTGLIPNVASKEEEQAKGVEKAGEWLGGIETGMGSLKAIRASLDLTRDKVDALRTSADQGSFGETIFGGHDAEIEAEASALEKWTTATENALRVNRKQRQIAKGARDTLGVFDIRNRNGQPGRAVRGLRADLGQNLRGASSTQITTPPGPYEDALKFNEPLIKLAQVSMDEARAAAKGHPKMKDDVRELTDFIVRRFDRMGVDIGIINGKIYQQSDEKWAKIQHAIVQPIEVARQEAHTKFTQIQQDALGQLVAMGMNKSDASKLIGNLETVSTTTAKVIDMASGGGKKKKARGGVVPGAFGGPDNVMIAPGVLAAGGERVVNQHQMGEADAYLRQHGTSLDHIIHGNQRMHQVPPPSGRPSWMRRHSRGGSIGASAGGVEQPPGDPGSEVVQAGYGQAVGQFLRRFNMDLTQGYGGASSPSVSPGHTTLGVAPSLDVVPKDGDWDGAFASGLKWALGQGMQVGYDGQYGTQSWSNHGEGNHAHIDWDASATGGLKGMGAAASGMVQGVLKALKLKPQKSKLGGIPGALSQRAMDVVRGGMQKRLNDKIGGGVAGAGIGAIGATGGTLGMPQLEQLARGAGMANPHLMAAIAMAESGGRVGVINSIGATGLWQVLQSAHPQYSEKMLLSAGGNARAAAEILGGQGLSAWEAYTNGMYQQYMARGGAIPNRYTKGGSDPMFQGWFGRGGTFDTHGPAKIGVGEAGDETITVTPKGQKQHGGSGSGNVTVSIGKIEVNRKGDVKKIIEEEFKQLGLDIEILSGSESSEDALV